MQEGYQPARTDSQIEWICDVCKKPIDNILGGVWITHPDIREASRRSTSPEGPMSIIEILALPDGPKWHVTHDSGCTIYKETQPGAYWLPIESLRSHTAVLKWTGHLLGKNWLAETNWDDIIERAVKGEVG